MGNLSLELGNMAAANVLAENESTVFSTERVAAVEVPRKTVFETEVLIGGVEIIEKLSNEWTNLCQEGSPDEPFFRPEWFAAFVKNFESEILLITVRRAGKLRAVLPLVANKSSLHGVPVRKLQAVFNLQTQRFDLIHCAQETERKGIIAAIWKEIESRKYWQILEFRLVKKDSWLNDLLELAASENHKTGVWQMDSAPFITLPQGDNKQKLQEEFSLGLKRHFRQELKRRLKRLRELGTVEFVKTSEYSAELMQRYFELEASSWKGRGGTAASCDRRSEQLHEDFACAVAAKDALSIYELKLDGKTISMSINIRNAEKTIFWKTSFDEKYSRYSPGNLVIQEFLKDCIDTGSTELDMLSPATDYKKVWATGEREHAAFYVFRRGIAGSLLWHWKFSIISHLRKYKKSV